MIAFSLPLRAAACSRSAADYGRRSRSPQRRIRFSALLAMLLLPACGLAQQRTTTRPPAAAGPVFRPESTTPTSAAAAASPTPAIRATLSPDRIVVNTPTVVTVTAAPSTRTTQVALYLIRKGPSDRLISLGQLHDDGLNGDQQRGDGVYTIQQTFNETAPGSISLLVTARFQPAGVATMARTVPPSPVMTLTVTGKKAQPGWGNWVGSLLQGLSKPPAQPPADSRPTDTPLVAHGLSFRYPQGLRLDRRVLELNGPISLIDCRGLPDCRLQQGGVVPLGAAIIDIARAEMGPTTLEEAMRKDLGEVQTQATSVAESRALRAYYTDDLTPQAQVRYENYAVYVAHDKTLYKFFVSYRAGDKFKPRFVEAFDHILATVQFSE